MALEISRYELSSDQIDRINNFINQLDNSANELLFPISNQLLLDLNECIQAFKNSKSIYWIREDFVNEVLLFENCKDIYL